MHTMLYVKQFNLGVFFHAYNSKVYIIQYSLDVHKTGGLFPSSGMYNIMMTKMMQLNVCRKQAKCCTPPLVFM